MRKAIGRRKFIPMVATLEGRELLTSIVALIDTGVNLTDVANNPGRYDMANAYDARTNQSAAQYGNSVVQDNDGHGSVVADSIKAGITATSSSADVKILPIRVTEADGHTLSYGAILNAIYYAADHGADVINISSVSGGPDTNAINAIRYAESKNIVVVVGAGNESINIDTNTTSIYTYPSLYHLGNMLTVAAADSSGNLTGGSNYGPIHVDLAAPRSPTSFAAGYTSGVTAVVAELRPDWTAAQVANRVKGTVTPLSPLTNVTVTGGMINPTAAVNGILTAPTRKTAGDLDGDLRADFSVYGTGSNNQRGFTTVVSSQGFNPNQRLLQSFGPNRAVTTMADYDGDGKADYSIFGEDGQGGFAWYWISSKTGVQSSRTFGWGDWIPVTADFDGDGKDDFSLYGKNGNGVWGFVTLLSSTNFNVNQQSGFNFNGAGYGWEQAMPLAGDFDGDGKADYSLYAPNSQGSNDWTWISSITGLQNSVSGFGRAGSVPLAADFDGDGRSDLSVYGQNSNGVWGFSTLLSSYNFNVANQSGFNFNGAGYGWSGAIPSVADYDGDGKADYSLFSPSTSAWSWISSKAGGAQNSATIPGLNQDFMPTTAPFITRFRVARGLQPGRSLSAGQSIASPNLLYTLLMQNDGNLVLYGPNGSIWSSQTGGNPGAKAIMQNDGNLVIYNSIGQPIWSSATGGHAGAYLIVQNNGQLKIIYGATAIWTT